LKWKKSKILNYMYVNASGFLFSPSKIWV